MENAEKRYRKIITDLYELLESIIIAVVFVVLLFTLVFRIFVVSGPSMFPTLKDGDRIIVSNLFYTPKQGDIICFSKPEYKDEVLVKRIIALEGQTVDINNDMQVVVDGKVLDESYLVDVTTTGGSLELPYTVEQGKLFVMGDNRPDSFDSRYTTIGTIDINNVLGRLILRAFPRPGPVK